MDIAKKGLDALNAAGENPLSLLGRHLTGDWGTVCLEDARANDEATSHEGQPERQGRVLSAYETELGQTVWVITEWDRSATTLLLSDEY